MAVTDLTGTTWYFNSIINLPPGTAKYLWDINFTINDGSVVNCTRFDLYDDSINYTGFDWVYEEFSGWIYEDARTIHITGGADVTDATFIEWLEENAVQQVTRNDYFTCTDELASIADAIRTKGGTSASLIYPDGFVTAINNLPTKVLGVGTFSGYDSPFDIQVTAEDYSDGNWDGFSSVTVNINTPFYDGSCDIINPLITFTIAGTTYQAEEGMTWINWVSSDYNTGSFVVDTTAPTDLKIRNSTGYVNYSRSTSVSANDIIGLDSTQTTSFTSYVYGQLQQFINIIENNNYSWASGGGGAD